MDTDMDIYDLSSGKQFLADFGAWKIKFVVLGRVKISYDTRSLYNEGAVGSRRLSVCGVGSKIGNLLCDFLLTKNQAKE